MVGGDAAINTGGGGGGGGVEGTIRGGSGGSSIVIMSIDTKMLKENQNVGTTSGKGKEIYALTTRKVLFFILIIS